MGRNVEQDILRYKQYVEKFGDKGNKFKVVIFYGDKESFRGIETNKETMKTILTLLAINKRKSIREEPDLEKQDDWIKDFDYIFKIIKMLREGEEG